MGQWLLQTTEKLITSWFALMSALLMHTTFFLFFSSRPRVKEMNWMLSRAMSSCPGNDSYQKYCLGPSFVCRYTNTQCIIRQIIRHIYHRAKCGLQLEHIYLSCILTVYNFKFLHKFQICFGAICLYSNAKTWKILQVYEARTTASLLLCSSLEVGNREEDN